MIRVENVSKQIEDTIILKNISFEIGEGECVALIGPNGAGKSTLFGCILGDDSITSGKVWFDQNEITQPMKNQKVSVLYQENTVPEKVRVRELIEFFRAIYQSPLSLMEIDALLGFSNEQKRQYAHQLSGGQKRLLSFVLTLVGQPKVLFLDEPTAAMDTSTRHRFWKIIEDLKQQGCTIFYSSHYIEEVEHTADRILVLHQGTLVRDTTPFQMKSEEREKYFVIPLKYEAILQSTKYEVYDVNVRGNVIHFMTKEANEIWDELRKSGCKIAEIEVNNKTLLNSLFDYTERKQFEEESVS